MSGDSVTRWLSDLKVGRESAAEKLWEQYFGRLIQLAHRKLGRAPRRMADEEDVAVSAFDSFYQGVSAGRFPRLDDRDDLWRLLLTITERKALRQVQTERRQKRGGGRVRGQSAFLKADAAQAGDDRGATFAEQAVDAEPTPEIACQLVEQFQHLLNLLEDEVLRQVAVMKLEGYTNDEVAARLGYASRSVTRKLDVIRKIWLEEIA